MRKCSIVLSILSVIMLCLSVAGCSDTLSKDGVFSIVHENKEIILQNITEENVSDCETISGIKTVTQHGTYIEFYCGGTGMGGETSYSGFYYFSNDDLQSVMNELGVYIGGTDNAVVFTPEGSGYIWEDDEGDNSLYIERIDDHFYYFIQCF